MDKLRTAGSSLIELLIVISIIGVLTAILLPSVQAIRASSRRSSCQNRVRQLAIGAISFESAQENFPVGVNTSRPKLYSSWLQEILLYVDSEGLYNKAQQDYENYPSPFGWHDGLRAVVSVYQCPSNPRGGYAGFCERHQLWVATTDYLGVLGTDHTQQNGILIADKAISSRDIMDGASNTLLIGERAPGKSWCFGWWYAGTGQDGFGSADMILGVNELKSGNAGAELASCSLGPHAFERGHNKSCDNLHYWSYHKGGSSFGLADGSVRFMKYGSQYVLNQISTRNSGEIQVEF